MAGTVGQCIGFWDCSEDPSTTQTLKGCSLLVCPHLPSWSFSYDLHVAISVPFSLCVFATFLRCVRSFWRPFAQTGSKTDSKLGLEGDRLLSLLLKTQEV